MNEIIKKRSITKPDSNVKAILYSKLKHYQEQNLPIEILTDYIGKGLQQIDDEIQQLKNYKKMIDEKIKDLQNQTFNVKVQGAEFLRENGLDKLEGIEVSSITINSSTPSSEEVIQEKTFITDLTQKEINDFLVTQNLGRYETKDAIKVTNEIPETLKVNKKRAKKDETY